MGRTPRHEFLGSDGLQPATLRMLCAGGHGALWQELQTDGRIRAELGCTYGADEPAVVEYGWSMRRGRVWGETGRTDHTAVAYQRREEREPEQDHDLQRQARI